MFADKMGVVRAPDLVNDRLVLLGDAGYCPTALSGMGASLSIYGAKALAHFINDSRDDIAGALSNYNAMMQPIIRKFQENARMNAASFLPADKMSLQHFATSFSGASESEAHKRLTEQIILTDAQLNFVLS
jgi:2-polyprenyl-6-methoxyphenol hydroxylase-like FAD-dependent oxidoreductase